MGINLNSGVAGFHSSVEFPRQRRVEASLYVRGWRDFEAANGVKFLFPSALITVSFIDQNRYF
jgi:hypothetical protein